MAFDCLAEAPRGGAGIEINTYRQAGRRFEAPRGGAGIEIPGLSAAAGARRSPSWRGWY